MTLRVNFLNRNVAFRSRQITLRISAHLLKLGSNLVLNSTIVIRLTQPLFFLRPPNKLICICDSFFLVDKMQISRTAPFSEYFEKYCSVIAQSVQELKGIRKGKGHTRRIFHFFELILMKFKTFEEAHILLFATYSISIDVCCKKRSYHVCWFYSWSFPCDHC